MKRTYLNIGLLILCILLLPNNALADGIPVFCGNLPGCNNSAAGIVGRILTLAVTRLNLYGYLIGGLFVMIGGGRILLSAGNEERVTSGKNTILWALAGIFLANFAVPFIAAVFAEISTMSGGADLVIAITKTLMQTIFDLMNISLLGVALLSGMTMVVSRGKDEEMTKARNGLMYAAAGAMVINLAAYIINALINL